MAGSIHEQLVEILSRLGDRALAKEHAVHIHTAVIAANRGYDIGQDETGYYARPRREKPQGPVKDFRVLASLARKAIGGKISMEEWAREWVARAFTAVWRLCRPFLLERGHRTLDATKLFGFSAPGFTTVIPKPEAVLPALETTLERSRSKVRKPDQAADHVIAAVLSAYSALTGNPGGRTFLASGQPGRLLRLGHEVDDLFGTNFFPRRDSTRLRRVWHRSRRSQK
jgi:hypothetical protein